MKTTVAEGAEPSDVNRRGNNNGEEVVGVSKSQ
jgi:hypothetical protein